MSAVQKEGKEVRDGFVSVMQDSAMQAIMADTSRDLELPSHFIPASLRPDMDRLALTA